MQWKMSFHLKNRPWLNFGHTKVNLDKADKQMFLNPTIFIWNSFLQFLYFSKYFGIFFLHHVCARARARVCVRACVCYVKQNTPMSLDSWSTSTPRDHFRRDRTMSAPLLLTVCTRPNSLLIIQIYLLITQK